MYYVYYLQFSMEDAECCNYIRTWIRRLIRKLEKDLSVVGGGIS